MSEIIVSLDDIQSTAATALIRHGAKSSIAASVAHAIRIAEKNSNLICGLYYLDSYCTQLRTGRVDGVIEPVVTIPKPSSVKVDARLGFAQPAFAKGIDQAVEIAKTHGSATLAICHSHTCTSMAYFTEQISHAGLIGIGMTNAPACVSPPGGTQAVLGTNPISMSVPAQNGGVAFTFDQSTSAVAIGKIRVAAAAGEKIPLGWAVDLQGNPTDNPNEALKGSLVSAGGYKGYGFGLMAEVFAAAVTGSLNSVTASPLKTPKGPAHDLGQFYFLVDPTTFSGDDFWDRLTVINKAVTAQQGARLPGSARAEVSEVSIDATLWEDVVKLAEDSRLD